METVAATTENQKISVEEMIRKWRQDELEKQNNSLKDFAKILKPFKEKGFDRIVVTYSGCGDSGEIYSTDCMKDGKTIDPCIWKNHGDKSDPVMPEEWKEFKNENRESGDNSFYDRRKLMKFLDPLHEACYNILTYDWYNNEGGEGDIIFDLKNMTIEIQASHRVETIEPVSESEQKSHFQLEY